MSASEQLQTAPIGFPGHSRIEPGAGDLVLPSIPDYNLIRRIGGGAYGEVWLARSRATGMLRAAKIVWRRTFEDARPFEREFEGIQRFERICRQHPSQLALFHIGRNDAEGYFYYVMELADALENPKSETRSTNAELTSTSERQLRDSGFGPSSAVDFGPSESEYLPHTLREELHCQGRLPPLRCIEIGFALASALGHLHKHGLVHRDIKPSNIIFVGGAPKLADIGLVTEAGDSQSIVGTEGYLPPEGPGAPQADIYSLGKLLYETSTGMDRRRFPELPEGVPAWPDRREVVELNEIVLKACASNPGSRYRSAEEVLADLRCLKEGGSVRRQRARERRRRTGGRLLAAAGAAAAVTAGMFFLAHQPRAPQRLSKSPEAEKLYRKALYEMVSDTVERRVQALSDLNEAIKLDPRFVNAYFARLEVYYDGYVGERMPPHFNQLANFRDATKALHRVAPNSAQYYTAQGLVDFCEWHFDKAIEEESLATRLDPNFLRARSNHAWFTMMVRGDGEASLREFKEAERLDPNDVYLKIHMSYAYYAQRQFAPAITLLKEVLNQESRTTQLFLNLADFLVASKQYDEALNQYERFELLDGGDPERTRDWYAKLRKELARNGARGLWQAELERGPEHLGLWGAARLYARLGSKDRAFALLYQALDKEHDAMWTILIDDALESLHDDPRFEDLVVRRMGFHPMPGVLR